MRVKCLAQRHHSGDRGRFKYISVKPRLVRKDWWLETSWVCFWRLTKIYSSYILSVIFYFYLCHNIYFPLIICVYASLLLFKCIPCMLVFTKRQSGDKHCKWYEDDLWHYPAQSKKTVVCKHLGKITEIKIPLQQTDIKKKSLFSPILPADHFKLNQAILRLACTACLTSGHSFSVMFRQRPFQKLILGGFWGLLWLIVLL